MRKTFTPRDYQSEAIEHLASTPRCGLWMPMGGGKTVSTLTALSSLDLVEDVFPALVLAPLRVARSTWPAEIDKWEHLSHLRTSVIVGNPAQRKAALEAEADVYCMNYDNLVWLVEETGRSGWPFKTVIADESTRLKSFRLRQGGARARALGKVAHEHVQRFIELTGTPSPNGIKDLWGQLWFLDKGERLGRTYTAFSMRWFRKGYDGYSLIPYDHAQEEVQDRVKDICLTVRTGEVDEVNEIPIWVDLPPKARQLYDEMEKDMFVAIEQEGLDDFEVEAGTAAVKYAKCRQIANGVLYGNDGEAVHVHDEKLKALESVIEEAAGTPLLVAYVYVEDKNRLLKAFKGAEHLDSDPLTIERWNKGAIPLLAAHPASAGHGLNMQDGSNIMADFGIDPNLEHDMQIIERIGPMRQKQSGYDRPVYRYRIMARGTVEEWAVLPALQGKRSVQDILLEATERRKKDG